MATNRYYIDKPTLKHMLKGAVIHRLNINLYNDCKGLFPELKIIFKARTFVLVCPFACTSFCWSREWIRITSLIIKSLHCHISFLRQEAVVSILGYIVKSLPHIRLQLKQFWRIFGDLIRLITDIQVGWRIYPTINMIGFGAVFSTIAVIVFDYWSLCQCMLPN